MAFNELQRFAQPTDIAGTQDIGNTDFGTIMKRISASLGPEEAQAAEPSVQNVQAQLPQQPEQDPNFDAEFAQFEQAQTAQIAQPEQELLSADPEIIASPEQQFENDFAQFEADQAPEQDLPSFRQRGVDVTSFRQQRAEMLKGKTPLEVSRELITASPMTQEEGLDFVTNIKMGLFDSDEGKFKFLEHMVGQGKVRLEGSEFEVHVDGRWQPVIGNGLNSLVDLAGRFIGQSPQIFGSLAGSAFGAGLSIPTTGAAAAGLMMGGGSMVGSMVGDVVRGGFRYMLGLGSFEPLDEAALEQIFSRGALEFGFAGVAGTAARGVQKATGANVIKELYETKLPRSYANLPESPAELPGQPAPRTSGKQLRAQADAMGIEVTPKQLTSPAPAGPNFAALAESKIMENPQEYPKFIKFAVKQTQQINRAARKIFRAIIPEAKLLRGKNLADEFHNRLLERSQAMMNKLHKVRRMAHSRAEREGVTFTAPKLYKKLKSVLKDGNMFKPDVVDKNGQRIVRDEWSIEMGVSEQGYNKLKDIYELMIAKSFPKRVGVKPEKLSKIFNPDGTPFVVNPGDPGEVVPFVGFTIEDLFNIKNQIFRGTRINPLNDDEVTKHTKKVISNLYGDAKADFVQSLGGMIDDPHVTNEFITITNKFTSEADDIVSARLLVANNKNQLAAALVSGDAEDLHNVLRLLDDDKLHRSIAFDFLNNLVTDTRLRNPGQLGRIGPQLFDRLEEMNRKDPGKLEAIFEFGGPTTTKDLQGKTLKEGEVLLRGLKRFAKLVTRLEAIDVSKAGAKNTVEAKAVEAAMAPWSRFFGVKALVHFLAGYPKAKEYLSRNGFDKMLSVKIPKAAIGTGFVGGQLGGELVEDAMFNDQQLEEGTQFVPQEQQ